MTSFTTPTIVLRSQDVGEHDWLLTVLTRERGKLEVLAKGIRKPESKLRASVNPLQLLEMYIIVKRRFTLGGSVIMEAFPEFRSELPSYVAVLHVCDIVCMLYPDEHQDMRAFDRLVDVLRFFSSRSISHEQAISLAVISDLKFMTISGTTLRFDLCTSCGRAEISSIGKDGAKCSTCAKTAKTISSNTQELLLLQEAFSKPLQAILGMTISHEQNQRLLFIIQFLLTMHDVPLGNTFSSLELLMKQGTMNKKPAILNL